MAVTESDYLLDRNSPPPPAGSIGGPRSWAPKQPRPRFRKADGRTPAVVAPLRDFLGNGIEGVLCLNKKILRIQSKKIQSPTFSSPPPPHPGGEKKLNDGGDRSPKLNRHTTSPPPMTCLVCSTSLPLFLIHLDIKSTECR